MKITLSDGTTVTLSERFTHKINRAFLTSLNPDLQGKVDVRGVIEATEAALPLLIERIERDGAEIPFSREWLDDLLAEDYDALQAAVIEIKNRGMEAGKKNRG